MRVLGGGPVSYERGTPVNLKPREQTDWAAPSTVFGTEEMRPVSHPDRELATHPGETLHPEPRALSPEL